MNEEERKESIELFKAILEDMLGRIKTLEEHVQKLEGLSDEK